MVAINFRVPEKLVAQFKASVAELKQAGASVGAAEAFQAALLMWARAPKPTRGEWVGMARNFDLEPLSDNSLGQGIATVLDAAEQRERPPARKRKKAAGA